MKNRTGKLDDEKTPRDELGGLFHASMMLILGRATVTDWLQIFASVTASDAACSERWTRGYPVRTIASAYGDMSGLLLEERQWCDQLVSQSCRREPGFIEDFLTLGNTCQDSTPARFRDPRCLVAVVDWDPACILVILMRANDSPAWTAADREKIHSLLSYVRESVEVHKTVDRNRWISILARDILNKSPRGILILSEDGTVEFANTRATEIMAANDGISESNGRLVIRDKVIGERIHSYLANLGSQNNRYLPEMDWNMAVKKTTGGPPYQLILGSLKLDEWNVESRYSDHVGIIHLADPVNSAGVTPEQLIHFYGFTKAQARLAAQLFQGHTINDAATTLHISVNTARTHVRGIYAKTGVKTQAELIALLSAGLKSYGQTVEDS